MANINPASVQNVGGGMEWGGQTTPPGAEALKVFATILSARQAKKDLEKERAFELQKASIPYNFQETAVRAKAISDLANADFTRRQALTDFPETFQNANPAAQRAQRGNGFGWNINNNPVTNIAGNIPALYRALTDLNTKKADGSINQPPNVLKIFAEDLLSDKTPLARKAKIKEVLAGGGIVDWETWARNYNGG